MLPMVQAPSFITKLPSTGVEIKYRPFLVKEEKVLLMALEGQDQKEIMNAVFNIVSECIITNINANEISTFDLEYLFLRLRGKSVGEIIELTVGHQGNTDCDGKSKVSINIDDIEVQGNIEDGKIMIDDDVGVKMRYPNITDMEKIQTAVQKDSISSTFEVISMCTQYIFDRDNVYNDYTDKELESWYENLSQQQFEKISNFFSNVPKLAHDIYWTCPKCGESETIHLEGMESFFT